MLIHFKDKHPQGLSTATIQKRNQQLRDISLLFDGDGHSIDTQIFDRDDFFLKLSAFLHDFKDYTKRSYFYCLMCFTINNNCNAATHFKLAQLYNDSHPVSRTTADHDATIKIDRLRNAENHNCKILHAVLFHVGAIRLFELINTTIIDIPHKNFLDLKNGTWLFRTISTKQKKDREIILEPEFILEISKLIHNNTYLFTRKNGLPYKNSGTLSAVLKKYTGINFQTIRRSDVHIDLSSHTDLEKAKAHALILGHTLKTQINNYANPKPGEQPIIPKQKIKVVVKKRYAD